MRMTKRDDTAVVELTRLRAEDAERIRRLVPALAEHRGIVLDFRRVREWQRAALLAVVEVVERLRGRVELRGVTMQQARELEELRAAARAEAPAP